MMSSDLPSVRTIGADQLRRQLGREKGQCTWCGGPVPKRRRSWCSKACVDEFTIRYSPSSARWHVEKRDGGVCARCGSDTKRWAKLLRLARNGREELESYWRGGCWRRNKRGRRNIRRIRRYRKLSFKARRRLKDAATWEADHIIPVVEGGAAIGLENLRTLCLRCHKAETAALAARRAKQRQIKGKP